MVKGELKLALLSYASGVLHDNFKNNLQPSHLLCCMGVECYKHMQ